MMNVGKANSFDWSLFLRQLSRDLLERLEDIELESLSPETVEMRWLGYEGATDVEISDAEVYLEATFSPSYRSFLAVSNGWHKLDDFINRLWSTHEIEWLTKKNQELIDAWLTGIAMEGEPLSVPAEEYFIYGDEQDTTLLRNEYLQTALEIGGNSKQGLLLLNPQVTFEDGEWEAWYFAPWLPGAQRYRSFRELMQDKHKHILDSLSKLRELS